MSSRIRANRNFILTICLVLFGEIGQSVNVSGQTRETGNFSLSSYLEFYGNYDFDNPNRNKRPSYLYNHARHSELSANLILVQGSYTDSSVRAQLGLMAGDYVEYNLGSEPLWARSIYQASAGVKLSRKQQIWLDAGIFPSHLGAESPIGAENMTLSRSLCAEGSPYYEAGLNLNYTDQENRWYAALLVLNGWQQIRKSTGQHRPALGMQVKYTGNPDWTLNYGNFLGWSGSDAVRSFRTFHNFYTAYDAGENLKLFLGFDVGTQWLNRIDRYAFWYTPLIIASYQLTERWTIAGRIENYYDEQEVIIDLNQDSPINLIGISVNADFRINQSALLRMEYRQLHRETTPSSPGRMDLNQALTSSLCIKLP